LPPAKYILLPTVTAEMLALGALREAVDQLLEERLYMSTVVDVL